MAIRVDSGGVCVGSRGVRSACCLYCCFARVTGGGDSVDPACDFSSKSNLSVSVTSTASGTGTTAFNDLITWLNSYWAANPTFSIGWNTHQGNTGTSRCDGQYDDSGIEGFWATQIGTLNGYPVWAFNNGLDSGVWEIQFWNGDKPLADPGPNSGHGVGITLQDAGDGTCAASGTLNLAGSPAITGTITASLAVENNDVSHCPEDEGF